MAEGLTRELLGETIEPWSAGVETHGLNPSAVRAMSEIGIDISSHQSENVRDMMDVPFDLVVTVCDSAREACPVFPGKIKQIHKSFDDPPYLASLVNGEEEKMECYRRVRDQIKDFITQLPEHLD